MTTFSRREFLGLLALAGAGVACGRGGTAGLAPVQPGATFDEIFAARPQSLGLIVPPYEFLSRRAAHMAFVLQTNPGEQPIEGADAGRIWFAKQRGDEAVGPFDLRPLEDGFNDNGIYGAKVEIPADGTWLVLAEAQRTTGAAVEVGIANVLIGPQPSNEMPRPGDPAISVATPTPKNARGVDPICTRDPICAMHELSLDKALGNGKPTVMIIGTPKYCQSRFCGPEVDIVEAVAAEHPEMNFVHMEVLKDDASDTVAAYYGQPPEGYRGTPLAPGPIAWKLAEEPVIYFIHSNGIVQERLNGAVDGVAVRDALTSLA